MNVEEEKFSAPKRIKISLKDSCNKNDSINLTEEAWENL